MIPRIRHVNPLSDYRLLVEFDEGRQVVYDVAEDIAAIPDFSDLKTVCGLFAHPRLDSSRTIVYWNDRIDLPSDTLYEYGEEQRDKVANLVH